MLSLQICCRLQQELNLLQMKSLTLCGISKCGIRLFSSLASPEGILCKRLFNSSCGFFIEKGNLFQGIFLPTFIWCSLGLIGHWGRHNKGALTQEFFRKTILSSPPPSQPLSNIASNLLQFCIRRSILSDSYFVQSFSLPQWHFLVLLSLLKGQEAFFAWFPVVVNDSLPLTRNQEPVTACAK